MSRLHPITRLIVAAVVAAILAQAAGTIMYAWSGAVELHPDERFIDLNASDSPSVFRARLSAFLGVVFLALSYGAREMLDVMFPLGTAFIFEFGYRARRELRRSPKALETLRLCLRRAAAPAR